MSTKYFIPVLKTKRVTEKYVLGKLVGSFDSHFFPLIEWTTDKLNSSVKKYNEILNEVFHMESIYRKTNSLETIIDKTNELFTSDYIVPCLKILPNECDKNQNIIIDFIDNKKGRVALNISIDNDIDSIIAIASKLTFDDYLIIDIGLNNYKFVKSLLLINNIINNTNIIILSTERNDIINNRSYNGFGYNSTLFNLSVIDSIKKNTFIFDGFASYCTLRNDLTPEDQIITKTYAILFLYDYFDNDVFTIRIDNLYQTSISYNELTNTILNSEKHINEIKDKIKNSPLAGEVFDGIIRRTKGSVVKYQEIATLNYIESVLQNIIRS